MTDTLPIDMNISAKVTDAPICEVPIEQIKTTMLRRRLDPEIQINPLAASIARVDQIHPILVTSELELIDGMRRLLACRKLGRKTILAKVLPILLVEDSAVVRVLEIVDDETRKEYEIDELLWEPALGREGE